MIGDKIVSDGEDFIVVGSGGEGLVGVRDSRTSETWEAPPRKYVKSGKFVGLWGKSKQAQKNPIDNLVIVYED